MPCYRLREFEGMKQGIRWAISLGKREGHDSIQLRVELLRLYEVFIKAARQQSHRPAS